MSISLFLYFPILGRLARGMPMPLSASFARTAFGSYDSFFVLSVLSKTAAFASVFGATWTFTVFDFLSVDAVTVAVCAAADTVSASTAKAAAYVLILENIDYFSSITTIA